MGASNTPRPVSFMFGLVVAVRYARGPAHIGCEERISVMWSSALHVEDVCDCFLLSCDGTFPRGV